MGYITVQCTSLYSSLGSVTPLLNHIVGLVPSTFPLVEVAEGVPFKFHAICSAPVHARNEPAIRAACL